MFGAKHLTNGLVQVARENYQLRLRVYFLEVQITQKPNPSKKLLMALLYKYHAPQVHCCKKSKYQYRDHLVGQLTSPSDLPQERLNQGELNSCYDEEMINLRAELAASRSFLSLSFLVFVFVTASLLSRSSVCKEGSNLGSSLSGRSTRGRIA